MQKPVVLVVEDDVFLIERYVEYLRGIAEVSAFETCKEALRFFSERQDEIKAIITDGLVPFSDYSTKLHIQNTMAMVERFRHLGFSGKIIAISSEDEYLDCLQTVGCDSGLNKNNLYAERENLPVLLGISP